MLRKTSFLLLIITVLGIITSCNDVDNERQLKDGDTIFFPDTAAFIREWKIVEHQMRADLFARDSMYNQLPFDTLELTYSMCDCPDWVDRTKGDIECKECTDFYIEPADSTLELPGEIYTSATTVRFYGVVIPGMNLPNGRKFTVPNPPSWTVFRYYGYEILRPYKIWAPRPKIWDELEDAVEVPLTVTIQ